MSVRHVIRKASPGAAVSPVKSAYAAANASTPGTGRSMQPRLTSSAVDKQTNQNKARPTTPRRLSPINTSTSSSVDPRQFKGSLSPKAAGSGAAAAAAAAASAANTKGSLSPTRANGSRGTSPRKKLAGNVSSLGTRVNRPSPVLTSNQKWSRTSPSAGQVTSLSTNTQVAGVSDGLNSIGINDMRQHERVFRRANQPSSAALSDSGANKGISSGKLPNVATGGNSPKSVAKKKMTGVSSIGSHGSGGQGGRGKASDGARSRLKPLTVVLDLDETLVHSTFHGSGARMYRQIEKRKSKIRRQVESFQLVLDDGDRVTVNKRPHVDEFMRALQAPEFEAHVFTAALDSYASPVLDRLEKSEGRRLFARRMYRDSCTPTGMGTFAKDLDTLYPDLSRVVLVDNNPISLMKQPSNGILVPSFFDDPQDDVLPTVLEFLRSLADAPDVRPVLRALKG